MSPILETRNLSKAFGSLRATQDVTLRFEPGGRYAIIGPNGAGKTTIFNLLAGNLFPDSGSILMSERDVTRLQLSQRARLGIARSFQKNSLFSEMTVRESLAFACLLREGKTFVFWRTMRSLKAPYDEALKLAEQTGLADALDRPTRFLSYGTQRQLEVALALACRPKVLLLDEPTAGTSPEETERMSTLIAGMPPELTIIVIEHDMDLVMDIAREIIVLDYGRVLAQGTPLQIRTSELVRSRYLGRAAMEERIADG
jgi:branched-chain amino acid transport system ATP-binding protein